MGNREIRLVRGAPRDPGCDVLRRSMVLALASLCADLGACSRPGQRRWSRRWQGSVFRKPDDPHYEHVVIQHPATKSRKKSSREMASRIQPDSAIPTSPLGRQTPRAPSKRAMVVTAVSSSSEWDGIHRPGERIGLRRGQWPGSYEVTVRLVGGPRWAAPRSSRQIGLKALRQSQSGSGSTRGDQARSSQSHFR